MGRNRILIIVAVVILIVGAAMAYAYYTGKNGQRMIVDNNTNQPLIIGGQKDAGGCLIAAGYAWCAPKQKCLRNWEEKCYVAEEAALTQIFATNHKQPVADTHITVVQLNDNFASGSISFGPEAGAGGVFLARMVNNAWTIDYEGNGSIDCVKIKGLGYPQDVLEGFCD